MNVQNVSTSRGQYGQFPPSVPSNIITIIQQFSLDAKALLHENLVAEYLFGSYAKETSTSLSDVDLLFLVHTLTPETRGTLSGLASDYALKYDVYISPVIKDQRVWQQNQQYNTLFYQEVTQYGIPL